MDCWLDSLIATRNIQELSREEVEELFGGILHWEFECFATLLAHPDRRLGVDSTCRLGFLLHNNFHKTRSVWEDEEEERPPTDHQLQAKVRRDIVHCRSDFCGPSDPLHNGRRHEIAHVATNSRSEPNWGQLSNYLVHLSLSNLPQLCTDTVCLWMHQWEFPTSISTHEILQILLFLHFLKIINIDGGLHDWTIGKAKARTQNTNRGKQQTHLVQVWKVLEIFHLKEPKSDLEIQGKIPIRGDFYLKQIFHLQKKLSIKF